MRVILIVRKPLEGSVADNALKHGTVALNIDGCRVGTFKNNTPSGMDRFNARLAELGYRPKPYQKGVPAVSAAEGRWPANLIVEHLPTCRRAGTRKGGGYTINRWDDGSKPFGGGAGHPYSPEPQPEQVEIWECTEGCPVAALDGQSGASRFFKQVGGLQEPTGE